MSGQIDDIKAEFFVLMNKMRQGMSLPPSTHEGLTHGEASALHMIYLLEGAVESGIVRPKELAPCMHVTPSALSQVLKALEEKGLLSRARSAKDNRAVSLVLTDEGRKRAHEIDQRWCANVNDCVEYVGREDFMHMMATLGKVFDFHAMHSSNLKGQVEKSSSPAAAVTAVGGGEEPCA